MFIRGLEIGLTIINLSEACANNTDIYNPEDRVEKKILFNWSYKYLGKCIFNHNIVIKNSSSSCIIIIIIIFINCNWVVSRWQWLFYM